MTPKEVIINMKKKYLFANWKMYLDYDASIKLSDDLKENLSDLSKNIVTTVFPSALAMRPVSANLESSAKKKKKL